MLLTTESVKLIAELSPRALWQNMLFHLLKGKGTSIRALGNTTNGRQAFVVFPRALIKVPFKKISIQLTVMDKHWTKLETQGYEGRVVNRLET